MREKGRLEQAKIVEEKEVMRNELIQFNYQAENTKNTKMKETDTNYNLALIAQGVQEDNMRA